MSPFQGRLLPFRNVLPTIAPDVFIASTAVVIGDVHMGPETSLWFHCVVRGDVHRIRIGARTNIQDGTVIHVSTGTHPTYIGAGVTIGHMALIHGCTLEDSAFVGMGATVMDAAIIETDGMLAAGSLLTPGKRVPSGELWGGRPARFVRKLSPEDIAQMHHIADHYVELAAEYRNTAGA